MIRDDKHFREWESRWLANDTLTLIQKFRLLDGMYEEAKGLGIIPAQDPLEGIQFKTQLAKDLNVRRAA
jgi:hypothetical protein